MQYAEWGVPAPVWNQNVQSSHKAPTAVRCGLPSSLSVVSQVERALGALIGYLFH